jgi:hypothetical protein
MLKGVDHYQAAGRLRLTEVSCWLFGEETFNENAAKKSLSTTAYDW